MAFQPKFACGYSSTPVHYVSGSEVAWTCGNALVVLNLETQKQRLLVGPGAGIQAFAANSKHGILAIAEKGYKPRVVLYRVSDLKQVAAISAGAELALSAIALSHDGELLAVASNAPDCTLSVWQWRQNKELARAALEQPAGQLSFHPADASKLCLIAAASTSSSSSGSSGSRSTVGGAAQLWTLEWLWRQHELAAAELQLGGRSATCHAWAPEGLYVGCASGETLCVDLATQEVSAEASTSGSSSPAAAISINSEGVLVGSSNGQLTWYSRAHQPGASEGPMEVLAQAAVGAAAVVSVEYGGAGAYDAVVGTADGCVLRVLQPGADAAAADGDLAVQIQPLVDCHVGHVTGVAGHPDGRHVMSCGDDGSFRVWDVTSGQLVGRRDFGARVSCMAAAVDGSGLVALGSEAGVIRLVSVADVAALPLLHRVRVHSASVTCLAFAPGDSLLASAASNQQLAFMHISSQASKVEASVLGYTSAPEPVLHLAWAPAEGTQAMQLLVSLLPGALLALCPPSKAAALTSSSSSTNLELPRKELQPRIIKIEVPLQQLAVVKLLAADDANADLAVCGVGTDKAVQRLLLPAADAAWAGLKGRAVEASAKAHCHHKPGSCLAPCPSGHLLASASTDGTVALHHSSLKPPEPPPPRNTRRSEAGAAAIRRSELGAAALGPPPIPVAWVHESGSGGARALAWDGNGRCFVSGGAAGSLFIHETQGSSHLVQPSPLSAAALAAEECPGAEQQDDTIEPTHVELVAAKQRTQADSAGEAARSQMAARLDALRARLQALSARNDEAPDSERLSEQDMVVDLQLMQDLKASMEQQVAATSEATLTNTRRQELVAERIRAQCWDAMDQKGALVTGMKGGLEVANFPLASCAANDAALKHVMTLRRIEAVERAALGLTSGNDLFRQTQDEVAAGATGVFSSTGASVAEDGELASPSASPNGRASSVSITGAAGAAVLSSPEAALYSDFDVTCPTRKAAQVVLYQRLLRDVKERFNEEHARVAHQKRMDADKITDINTRIDELLRELAKIGAAPNDAAAADGKLVPWFSPLEDLEEALLTVKDSEVKAERYLSPAQQAAAAAAAAAEEERQRRAAADDAFSRALKSMMGGTLVRAVDEMADLAQARPAWMNGSTQDFNEEQLREYKEYQAKEKAAFEERLKRKSVLETELRTLRAAAEDVATKFDEALTALSAKRLAAQGEVLVLELRLLLLAASAEAAAATGEAAEQALLGQLHAVQEQRAALAQELSDASALADEAQNQAAAIAAEERALDRALKKEFGGDADGAGSHYSRLAQLYKQRLAPAPGAHHAAAAAAASAAAPAGAELAFSAAGGVSPLHGNGAAAMSSPRHAAAAAAGSSGTAALALAPVEISPLSASARPEGLDIGVWEHFVEFRHQRGVLELAAREEGSKLTRLRRQLAHLAAADAAAAAKADAIADEVARLREARRAALYDVDVRLRLKQGQVEAQPGGLNSTTSSSTSGSSTDGSDGTGGRDGDKSGSSGRGGKEAVAFVPRALVEGMNGVICKKGGAKVELLREMADFKRGIYLLQWENEKADMEAQDVIALTKELQLLHVTKEFQQLIKAGPEAKASGAREHSSLEGLYKARQTLQAKRIDERRRKMRHMEEEIGTKSRENAEVQMHLAGLEKLLEEQARLRPSAVGGDDAAERRMRNLVNQRKLRDIADAQAAEIGALRAELDALQQRTFPSFDRLQPIGVADTKGGNLAPMPPPLGGGSGKLRGSGPVGGMTGSTAGQIASARSRYQ